ncbi:PREDICTED: T-lymphocyte surface antigen Ly-9-like [Dipodomys ordii]|uniref:T-lymphocyte surface antigen Ly-9-like n=1 Tax=Dipodomys ordii TaxID=10020 RepID=A0A1S3GD36_DIPOR|nr:PREDICTED: T-lymphocyte surface antigen Ly-9-like [Dipodomys ordii]
MALSGRRSCWLSLQVLLLRVFLFVGFQTVIEASSSCTLNRTVGASIQLPLKYPLGPNIQRVAWSWNPENERRLIVIWNPNNSNPQWYDFEDKYKNRFSVTKEFFLSIKDLSTEMSTVYTGEIQWNSGMIKNEDFKLCVYEPVFYPQILVHSLTSTSGWCNVSLECWIPGTTENVTVTWLNQSFSGELGQRGTLAAAPNSRNLSLSLSRSQLNGHLICVVSNPADQKNVTLDLSICPQMAQGSHWNKWIGLVAVVLLVILGIGLWIWKRKKTETGKAMRGCTAAPQVLLTEDTADDQKSGLAVPELYAEINLLADRKEDSERSRGHGQVPQVHTAYACIQEPRP